MKTKDPKVREAIARRQGQVDILWCETLLPAREIAERLHVGTAVITRDLKAMRLTKADRPSLDLGREAPPAPIWTADKALASVLATAPVRSRR